MLENLNIQNFAIVDRVEVDFDKGFNVITGETGAGKSIIIGALLLILGDRADKTCIRTGTKRCSISALFNFENNDQILKKIRQKLEELDIEFEDNEVIIRRVITASSSRSYINNTPVPLSTIRDISSQLVAVHGPNDNHGLVKTAIQKELLDAFGHLEPLIADCREKYSQLQVLKKEVEEFYQKIPSQIQLNELKLQFAEIADYSPELGEDALLKERHELAANANRLLEITAGTKNFVAERENCIMDELSSQARDFMELERLDSNQGSQLKNELYAIIDALQDFTVNLDNYAHRVDIDPNEFLQIEERMSNLNTLKRKFGPTLEDVLAFQKEASEKMDLHANSKEKMEALKLAQQQATKVLRAQADLISAARHKAAKVMAKQVSNKLKLLGFKNSDFAIELTEGEVKADGYDAIEFQFSPNIGEPLQPLRKVASSGEISRVMLALKTVLASADHTSLLVFDEIDANVGGTVANMVGAELAALGDSHQVLCISHLPQVAATGQCHFMVEKEVIDNRTRTNIIQLNEEERIQEITRMLGGDQTTLEVIDHAKAMISAHKK